MVHNHKGPVVDADGHVLEPADTWVKYIDPQYRDRAIRIERDANGFEFLSIDNKPLQVLYGQLGVLGGIEMDAEDSIGVLNAGSWVRCVQELESKGGAPSLEQELEVEGKARLSPPPSPVSPHIPRELRSQASLIAPQEAARVM